MISKDFGYEFTHRKSEHESNCQVLLSSNILKSTSFDNSSNFLWSNSGVAEWFLIHKMILIAGN